MDARRNNFVPIAGYLRGSNVSADKVLWFETIVRRGPYVKQKTKPQAREAVAKY
jgi:hypothetical protein